MISNLLGGARADVAKPGSRRTGLIKAWSFSALDKYEKCPYASYLGKVKKIYEPSGPAAERGTKIHEKAEDYVQLKVDTLPTELKNFEQEFIDLRERYKAGNVSIEGEWAFDEEWGVTDWKAKDCWARIKLDAFVKYSATSGKVIDHKGLPVDTPIPVPSGWTTMGALRVGDKVFNRDGEVTEVTVKSKVKNIGVYELAFDDGTTIQCDDEHLWWTVDGQELPVTELAPGMAIPVTKPIQMPDATLPIAPYTFGVWLAEGSKSSAEITLSTDDYEHITARIAKDGYELGKQQQYKSDKCVTYTIKNIRRHLVDLNQYEKRIPDVYLRASVVQRLALLQGFMDGDGHANGMRKQAVFNTTKLSLAKDVNELALSLGFRSTVGPYKANGFGKEHQAYSVRFRTNVFNPFSVPRKANVLEDVVGSHGRSDRRRIVSVQPVPSVPTQCIAVASACKSYLAGEQFCVTHNTGRKHGNEVKHKAQGQIYAIAAFLLHPEMEHISVEFWYLDHKSSAKGGNILQSEYTREQAMMFLKSWELRASTMTLATEFPARPSTFNCKWCKYKEIPVREDDPTSPMVCTYGARG